MPRLVPLRAPATEGPLLDRIREVRAAGDVPLVGDDRWPRALWDAVTATARTAAVPPGAAWATATSGTSGPPRIVVRTAESWRASFDVVARLLDAGPDDVVALPAPPSSSLTLFSLAHALEGGPQPALGRHGLGRDNPATCFHGTPQALRALLDAGSTTIRTALVGGSALDPALRNAAHARGIRVASYYGAAELSFVALDDGAGLRPFPGVDLQLRRGHVWVRSPYIALGYLGGPGGDGPLTTDGHWATVADLGHLTDGVLHLRGRADGAILTASTTVIPEEVEAVLRRLPGIRDAVVTGLPAPGIGEVVAVLVEPDDDAPGDANTVYRRTYALLAPASRPRRWFVGPIPRTSGGKPARAEVRRLMTEGAIPRYAR